MCMSQPRAPKMPDPPPLPPAPPVPAPPPKPPKPPKAAQPLGATPDLRIGGAKRKKDAPRGDQRVSSSSLRSTLNIGGSDLGGINS